MATPKPGEIRCPTCHRSTPPAAFCTQCGSAIPSDARARPRGMDRDELQERIRARRSGGDPFRRGGTAEDEVPGYERYQPEPEDSRARPTRRGEEQRRDHFAETPRPVAPAAPDQPRRNELDRADLTRDHDDDWAAGAAATGAAATGPEPSATAPQPRVDEPARYEEPPNVDHFDETLYGDEASYEYDAWEEQPERRGGGGLAILGFLGLGVLALLAGAMLAGIFGSEDPGVGANPSPSATSAQTPSVTDQPTAGPTTGATDGASPGATDEPPEDNEPVVFPDGFVAEAQPCLPGSAGTNGCDSNASENSGSLWAWVGFENGTENDVIAAELIGPDGASLSQGSIDLADIGCRPSCPGGWTYFPYSNLPPGEYRVEITRNGQPAGAMTFEVT